MSGLTMITDAGFTASYPLANNTIYDLSGNEYNMELIDNPTFTQTYGGEFTFNGTSQYVQTQIITPNIDSYFLKFINEFSLFCLLFFPARIFLLLSDEINLLLQTREQIMLQKLLSQ
jgi:hypothetical protein